MSSDDVQLGVASDHIYTPSLMTFGHHAFLPIDRVWRVRLVPRLVILAVPRLVLRVGEGFSAPAVPHLLLLKMKKRRWSTIKLLIRINTYQIRWGHPQGRCS